MHTVAGIESQITETFGTLSEYTESLYAHLGIELTAENKAELKPLISQAHSKGIATLDLVEIVKSGIS